MLTKSALCLAFAAHQASAWVEQIHLSYTGISGELAVDFVSNVTGAAGAYTSLDGTAWTASPATTFYAPNIGYMSQALLDFKGIAPGVPAYYMVFAEGVNSTAFKVTPVVGPRPEVFAVFGDFGTRDAVCLGDLLALAAKGAYDSVLHVGDWAYDLEEANSTVGNQFFNDIQGYAATKPVACVEGNHEACGGCAEIEGLGEENLNNFTEYKARFHATALYAGANAGTHTARYYSFNQGLTHFLVFTCEAYLYARDAGFLANQLAFMKADLAAVDRKVTPWVVALVHKDFTMEAEAYATFNPILQDNKVDILFCGHVHKCVPPFLPRGPPLLPPMTLSSLLTHFPPPPTHESHTHYSYNRYLPYDPATGEVDTASVSADGSVYTNPKFMTVIVTGASGNHERDHPYAKVSPSYTGTQNYGYGLFSAVNATHATWHFHTVRADGPSGANYSDTLTWVKQ
jgi:hypothetical protein